MKTMNTISIFNVPAISHTDGRAVHYSPVTVTLWRLQPSLCHVTPTCPAHTSASACEKLAQYLGESFSLAGTFMSYVTATPF